MKTVSKQVFLFLVGILIYRPNQECGKKMQSLRIFTDALGDFKIEIDMSGPDAKNLELIYD